MKIYFTADNQADLKLQDVFSEIVAVLNSAGVLVMSNLVQKNITAFSDQDLEKFGSSGATLLEKVDALVIEGSKSLPEHAYLIALALTYKKPILHLTQRGRSENKNLFHLKKDKNAAKFLHLAVYNKKDLEKQVIKFLDSVERGEGRESPNIKFTLRITPRIERYLRWKTNNTKISKADYLREMVESLIDNDEKYKKFIEKDK